MVRLTPLAASLPASVPFVGPEAQERARGVPFRARIGANESAFGPSPEAVAAMARAAEQAWMYGDPEMHDLRAAIAAHHGVPPACVMVGEGIDGLLGCLVRLLVAPGTPVVTTRGTYPTFNYHVTGFGGRLETVPYREGAVDLDALAAAAGSSGAPLVYLANPDNPMGGWHRAERVAALVEALPTGALLCLDEAYADFAPAGTAPALDPSERRLLRMRTFSKAHGLAGLRVGYAIGHPETIAAFDRVRNHFGVGRVAQAGALAALGDGDWLIDVMTEVVAGRERLAEIAARSGLRALPSATNFVTMDCGRDGAYARAVVAALAEAGVFVRMPFTPPEDRCIRVTVGSVDDVDLFAEVLPGALVAAARVAS